MSNWNVYKLVGHAIPIMWSIDTPIYLEVAKALVVAWDVHPNLYASSEANLSGLEGQGGGIGNQMGGRWVDEEFSSASYFQDEQDRVHKKMKKKRKRMRK